jgi:hypothetical protein
LTFLLALTLLPSSSLCSLLLLNHFPGLLFALAYPTRMSLPSPPFHSLRSLRFPLRSLSRSPIPPSVLLTPRYRHLASPFNLPASRFPLPASCFPLCATRSAFRPHSPSSTRSSVRPTAASTRSSTSSSPVWRIPSSTSILSLTRWIARSSSA